jgi:hypothetical protein
MRPAWHHWRMVTGFLPHRSASCFTVRSGDGKALTASVSPRSSRSHSRGMGTALPAGRASASARRADRSALLATGHHEGDKRHDEHQGDEPDTERRSPLRHHFPTHDEARGEVRRCCARRCWKAGDGSDFAGTSTGSSGGALATLSASFPSRRITDSPSL